MKKHFFVLTLWLVIISVFCGCTAVENDGSSQPQTSQASVSSSRAEEIPDNKPALSGSTIFIYMCGSNLETKQGLAGKNIDELLKAEVGDDLHIVIQTGGAKTWRSHGISNSAAQRYEIKNGKLQLLDTLNQLNMGDAQTLTDFLSWGQKNYSAERNMLILWDHGGGSVKGVCFDENYSFDSLTLTELHTALENTKLKTKFDIIGFDACLMASIETAAVVRDYADYMVASEEIEPSGGWDYKVIAESFSSKDDLIEVGTSICDSFMEKCEKSNKADISTLSLVDLSKLDPTFDQLDSLGKDLSEFVGNENAFSRVVSAAKRCEKFGYDSVFSGSSNMIDFRDFGHLVNLSDGEAFIKVGEIVEEAVIYSVTGEQRDNGGISFFYPIEYNEKEIGEYISLGVSEEYNKFLSTYYLKVPEKTLAFSDKGSAADNGAFKISLTPDSVKYLSTVTYLLIEKDEDGGAHILFSDMDIDSDWSSLTFTSNFKGTRRLYKGHPLYYTPFRIEDTIIEYSVPVIINGRNANMRYYYYPKNEEDKRFFVPRNFTFLEENWLKQFINPWEGDTVQLAESLIQNRDSRVAEYGEEFVMDKLREELFPKEITDTPLSGSTYYYVFAATDIFGNTFYSDMATFEMTKSYDELSAGPLPDGEYAAKVTNIEPYSLTE
ncbi:MAG: hypothetical protein IJ192_12825 [Clostridia bacterium]|nr:hypothetical protein [Clostridia bacterium]